MMDLILKQRMDGKRMIRYSPQEYFKRFFKKDLREVCREKYGEDFVVMYDMVNEGKPIGSLEETKIFLAMVEEAKKEI